jgi:hypothetical protein
MPKQSMSKSKAPPAVPAAPKLGVGDKGYLHKATRAKYRQELEKRQRRIDNEFKGQALTEAEWNLRFRALVENLPHLRDADRKEAEEQLTRFKNAASDFQVCVQWPPQP